MHGEKVDPVIPPNAKLPPSTMITLFTLPKPFVGHIGMIQRNAIQSWTRLHPDIDILVFGNEQGTADVAAEFGIRHFPDVDVNEYGTPRMSGYFQQAEETARHPRMCYVNADIILFPDLLDAVAKVDLPKFVMSGRRTDYDIDERRSTSAVPDWADALREDAQTNGTLHDFSASTTSSTPAGCSATSRRSPWAAGTGTTGSCTERAVSAVALVDASARVTAIHQNHDYRHIVHVASKGESRNQGGIESFTQPPPRGVDPDDPRGRGLAARRIRPLSHLPQDPLAPRERGRAPGGGPRPARADPQAARVDRPPAVGPELEATLCRAALGAAGIDRPGRELRGVRDDS